MSNELLAVVEYLERERGLDRETVLKAVEGAILSASKKSMGPVRDLRIEIDRKTCRIRVFAKVTVVTTVSNPHEQISLAEAVRYKPNAQVGDVIEIEVTPKDFGRIAAQTAKQAILHKIRQAEKERVYDEYKDRVGDIVSGTVTRIERGDIILDLGRAEAVMPASEKVPTERHQIGDRLRALVLKVEPKGQGPEIVVSRAHPDFVRRLFELEVSEIADKTVEIKAIAREPGFRSKIAVVSHDPKVDPVGACVGLRGIRVKNIVRELSGEKVDIVRWSDDIKTFVTNALSPAKLIRVNVDEENHTVRVIVDPDQLSPAIGKKGQNAKLTSKLTGWKLEIEAEPGAMSFEERTARAVEALMAVEGIDRERAEVLVKAGFPTLEGLLEAEPSDLESLEGFTPELARQILDAARKAYEASRGEQVQT